MASKKYKEIAELVIIYQEYDKICCIEMPVVVFLDGAFTKARNKTTVHTFSCPRGISHFP